MRKLAIAGILLIPAVIVVGVAAAAVATALDDRVGETSLLDPMVDFYERPNDTPQLFCSSPDPKPWPPDANSASLVLQDCAVGKTYTLARGRTVAVDLTPDGFPGFQIHGLTVSDSSILQTVDAPKIVSSFGDYFGVYRGVRSGRVDISALWRYCANGSCDDSLRWEVTVEVS